MSTEWLAPTSLQEALELRARYADDATVVAGGTFIGILMSQRLIAPQAFLSLHAVRELAFITNNQEGANENGQPPPRQVRIGAMTTHRALERSALIHQDWPTLASTFLLVASPRIRNQATIGGVLADADYASDPPTLLQALNARVVVRSEKSEREIPVEELIIGYYETSLYRDELLVEVHVPRNRERVVY